ncbi:MAG: isoleucine--tRNA ligase [Phycisphaerales bacterium]|nr:isoleucine--tRNA ligase [Phycisphaerales bacterium]
MSDTTTRDETKPNYKQTLNLPKTSFPMKANLVQNEPGSIKRWNMLAGKKGLYHAMRETAAGRERFVFHDGPPYANGSIHLGHLMNKCLKDFVTRSKFMSGYSCPFVPGWDCHGLPIEHKVMTDLVESGKAKKLDTLDDDTRRMAVRKECKNYAEKQVKLQSGQMERLLTVADYADPYLTMNPRYEAAVLEVLSGLCAQGLVYKALKPVHWSVASETALADAELEYQDREDLSVYVDFEAADGDAVYEAFGLSEDERPGAKPSFMIWTTTPWTLPANLAIAVHEKFEYSLVRVDGNLTVMATELVEKVCKAAKAEDVETLATTTGEKLVGLRYVHPLRDSAPTPSGDPDADTSKCYTVVSADYVTLEDGSGLVHTAPGHGADDYQTGLRVGLPVYCPVKGDGSYDETVPDWLVGMSIWEANELVAKKLTESGHMFHAQKFMHSYPHDWRTKTPVIFRSTEQWFVDVNKPTKRDGKGLRDMALSSTQDGGTVSFVPAWGRNRMRGMLDSRPDWCISRQRAWGLPIPAFTLPDGSAFMTAASSQAVADVVRAKGSDAWFTESPEVLLAEYDASSDPDAPASLKDGSVKTGELTKGRDILDVWFESGSSWNAVMRERSGGKDYPIDLYLEGSDQHRGWFQLSLLPSLGVMGKPAFRTLLTHGFMVDKEGKKLSKSKGAALKDLFDRYGADVLRWWVCSLAYENDVKVDEEFFKLAGESYRKVRNTLRFMLSNLDGYAHEEGASFDPNSLEAWVLSEFDVMAAKAVKAYNAYAFHEVHKLVYNFCNTTLSGEYLSAVKDRLYCDAPDSARRVRTQRALFLLTDGLSKLLAPVMCHTSDEAYRALHSIDPKDTDASVHLTGFPAPTGVQASPGWSRVHKILDEAGKVLEQARANRGIDNPLDAGLSVPDDGGVLAACNAEDLADLCGVSRFVVTDSGEITVQDLSDEPRCERSWKRDGTVKTRSDGGMLSDRDAKAVGVE